MIQGLLSVASGIKKEHLSRKRYLAPLLRQVPHCCKIHLEPSQCYRNFKFCFHTDLLHCPSTLLHPALPFCMPALKTWEGDLDTRHKKHWISTECNPFCHLGQWEGMNCKKSHGSLATAPSLNNLGLFKEYLWYQALRKRGLPIHLFKWASSLGCHSNSSTPISPFISCLPVLTTLFIPWHF